MTDLNSNSSLQQKISVLLLAAGLSTRFNGCKLVADFDGQPLVQHALKAARTAFVGAVNVVIGHEEQLLRDAIGEQADNIIVNRHYARGIGSSIAVGVRSLPLDTDAVIIILGDQPLVSAENLQRLANHWSGEAVQIVASHFHDGKGPPILFPRGCFAELGKLDGDLGARDILSSNKYAVTYVNCEGSARDVDTRDDLQQVASD